MDKRQEKTRKAIFKAFSFLLSQKSFPKITVQEIIDEADIGRSTFYAHFPTKDDLLSEMCEDLFSHVFSDKLHTEKTHDFSMKTGNPDIIITHILYHLLDNESNIISLFKNESTDLFLSFFQTYLNSFLAVRLLEGVDFSTKKVPYDFLVNHISNSFVSMIQWWIRNDLKETPEELAGYFIDTIVPIV